MKVSVVIDLLEKDGWRQVRTRGSHRQFKHDVKPGLVTVSGKPSAEDPARYVGEHPPAGGTGGLAMTVTRIEEESGFPEQGSSVAHDYLAIIERGTQGWGAYVPDLPGVAVACATEAEARRAIREAVAFHIEGLQDTGLPVPEPASRPHRVVLAESGEDVG